MIVDFWQTTRYSWQGVAHWAEQVLPSFSPDMVQLVVNTLEVVYARVEAVTRVAFAPSVPAALFAAGVRQTRRENLAATEAAPTTASGAVRPPTVFAQASLAVGSAPSPVTVSPRGAMAPDSQTEESAVDDDRPSDVGSDADMADDESEGPGDPDTTFDDEAEGRAARSVSAADGEVLQLRADSDHDLYDTEDDGSIPPSPRSGRPSQLPRPLPRDPLPPDPSVRSGQLVRSGSASPVSKRPRRSLTPEVPAPLPYGGSGTVPTHDGVPTSTSSSRGRVRNPPSTTREGGTRAYAQFTPLAAGPWRHCPQSVVLPAPLPRHTAGTATAETTSSQSRQKRRRPRRRNRRPVGGSTTPGAGAAGIWCQGPPLMSVPAYLRLPAPPRLPDPF
jgi:hypothetical protein